MVGGGRKGGVEGEGQHENEVTGSRLMVGEELYVVWGLGHFRKRSGRAGLPGATGKGFVCLLA